MHRIQAGQGRAPGAPSRRRAGPEESGCRLAALAALALLAAACGASTTGSTGSTGSALRSGGTVIFALDEELPGFNILEASDSSFQLGEVQNNVWPSVFVIHRDLRPHLDTEFVTSARETATNPQTIVYQINHKAVWSDGVPITADDFIYNWQVQERRPQVQRRRWAGLRGGIDDRLQLDQVGDRRLRAAVRCSAPCFPRTPRRSTGSTRGSRTSGRRCRSRAAPT